MRRRGSTRPSELSEEGWATGSDSTPRTLPWPRWRTWTTAPAPGEGECPLEGLVMPGWRQPGRSDPLSLPTLGFGGQVPFARRDTEQGIGAVIPDGRPAGHGLDAAQ